MTHLKRARHTTTAAAAVFATAGTLLTAVAAAPASAAVTCTSPVFKRQFFANTTFSGTPKKTDCDGKIDQDWTGAPAAGLPKDKFGVRWTLTRDFGGGGPFSFAVSVQDGARVYLDPGTPDARKIDIWKNTTTTTSKTVDLTIPAGKHTIRVDYVNWTGKANIRFNYWARDWKAVDHIAPLAPKNAAVSYDRTTGKVTLTWTKNQEMDLNHYRIYRRLKGQPYPAYAVGHAMKADTSFTTTLTNAGASYYFEVRAMDNAENESPGSADQLVVTPDEVAPQAPSVIWSETSTTVNAIRWTPSSGADAGTVYEVSRATSSDGPFTVVGTSTAPAYDDATAEANVSYVYRVRAIDAAGNASGYSYVSGVLRDTLAPITPQGLKIAEDDADGVTLVWQFLGYDATRHHIYRSTSPDTRGERIGTATNYSQYFTDATAEAGVTYYYSVTALDASGNESAASAVVTRTPAA
jgi:fibronectin type 3 domain-containing protein